VNWTGNVASPSSASTNVTVDANKTVTANFAQGGYNLTVNITGLGNVSINGITLASYPNIATWTNGTKVNITATPNAGYHFVNWTGDISMIANSSAAATDITMYDDYSITANFEINTYNLTIDSTDGGNVTDPGEGVFGSYDNGTVVNLTATPDAGYTFMNWTGDVGTIANVSAASTTITMLGNYSITANFEPESEPAAPGGGGGGGGGGAVYYISVNMLGNISKYQISRDGDLEQAVEVSSQDGRITISLGKSTACLDKDGKRLANISADEETDLPSLPENYHIIGKAYELEPAGAIFDPYLNLALSYEDNSIPQYVAEQDIYIAYYNATAGIWVPLTSQVDTENNTVTAPVTHFTTFAIMGIATPRRAEFTIANLALISEQVKPRQEIIASVNVTNTGGSEGSYTLNLTINGEVEQRKTATLAPQATETVAFTITKEKPGSYSVSIGGLTGEFTVTASWLSRYWWTIVVGIVVAGFLVYFLVFRRKRAHPAAAK